MIASIQNQLVEILISHFLNETNSSYANHSSNDFIDQAINAGYYAYGILGMIKEWGKNDYCQSPEYMAKQLTYVLFYKVEKVELKYNKQG
ncbi:TetR-like C-terminal domain-containing protein [Aerococcus urinaeequi]|uniref:TetR-like C-terminal domain-containing protein n=1 Tax=Aerococcus urinaeequi TaxID=51665 RepID=UPI003B3BC625